jgi:hypothetical protein
MEKLRRNSTTSGLRCPLGCSAPKALTFLVDVYVKISPGKTVFVVGGLNYCQHCFQNGRVSILMPAPGNANEMMLVA